MSRVKSTPTFCLYENIQADQCAGFPIWNYNCGNVRYNTHLYCLAVQAGFYSDAIEYLTATQEILVRSSAGTKGVKHFFTCYKCRTHLNKIFLCVTI